VATTIIAAYEDSLGNKFVEVDNTNLGLNIYNADTNRFGSFNITSITFINSETLAFSEPLKKWTSFYSYEPEYMVEKNIGMVSFKEGVPYVHNSPNVPYNNFYGKQSKSQIQIISNENPSNIKFYKTIQQESTTPWVMPEATNQFGQSTNLISEDFETIEGHHYAGFWKDENTPNIDNPLIEGDTMRSYTMSLLLENDSTQLEKLFSVGVKYEPSELSNR
jgi:hypothetical protein